MDDQRLQVLVVVSRPLVSEDDSPIALNPVRIVRDGFQRAFDAAEAPLDVRFLPRARREAIATAAMQPVHVVHFVGHGTLACHCARCLAFNSPEATSWGRRTA